MGLSSKQVHSGDGFSWGKNLMQAGALQLPSVAPVRQQQQQQQQQSGPPLKCPRCESTNTKFCYYNNYNRSQPRHLCKSCRRHWTKGGTLRNVPVGGGRKNKRLKTSDNTNTMISKTTIQPHHQHLPLEFSDQKKFSDIFYQSLFQPTSSLLPSSQSDFTLSSDSTLPFVNPSLLSSSLQMPSVLNYTGDALTSNDLTTTNSMATTMTSPMPVQWQVPTPNSAIDSVSYWNWEDLHTFSQTDAKQPWDEPLENK